MQGTIWKKLLRQCLGEIHREIKITFTPIPTPKKWVFIVGCYNSGTTLLSKVLAGHEMIGSLPTEGHFLTDQFPSEHDIGISRMWMYREDLYRLTEKDLGPDVIRIKKEWNMRMNKRSKPVFLEKSPQNGARTRWLQKHFENAYFIGVIRNGYAVSEGIARKAKPEYRMNSWPIETCAKQWCHSNKVLEEDAAHLDNFMWVRYEDFTENPQKELNNLLKFIGIDQYEEIDTLQHWSIHERSENIRNMNHESISRLSDNDIQAINRVAGECITHFGYPLEK